MDRDRHAGKVTGGVEWERAQGRKAGAPKDSVGHGAAKGIFAGAVVTGMIVVKLRRRCRMSWSS